MLHNKWAKTVLWGCSVEPELVKDPSIEKDLARYDLITARELTVQERFERCIYRRQKDAIQAVWSAGRKIFES